jgi:hypothetical protein
MRLGTCRKWPCWHPNSALGVTITGARGAFLAERQSWLSGNGRIDGVANASADKQKGEERSSSDLRHTQYWTKVLNSEEMVRRGVMTRHDLLLCKVSDTPKDASQYLKDLL